MPYQRRHRTHQAEGDCLHHLLINLIINQKVDGNPCIVQLLVKAGVHIALGDLPRTPADYRPLEEDVPANEIISGRHLILAEDERPC